MITANPCLQGDKSPIKGKRADKKGAMPVAKKEASSHRRYKSRADAKVAGAKPTQKPSCCLKVGRRLMHAMTRAKHTCIRPLKMTPLGMIWGFLLSRSDELGPAQANFRSAPRASAHAKPWHMRWSQEKGLHPKDDKMLCNVSEAFA